MSRPEPAVRRGRGHQLRLHHLPGGRRVHRGDLVAAQSVRQRRVPVLHRRVEPAVPRPPHRGHDRRRAGRAAVHVPGRQAAARRLRGRRPARHRGHAEPAGHELPAGPERRRGPVPGALAAAGRVQPAVDGLPVGLLGGRAAPRGRGVPAGAAGDRVAVRAVAASHARQRPGGRLAGQEPARPARRHAGPGRCAGRPERRDPGRVHQPVVAGRMGLRGDDRAVRGRDHRRFRQPSRRRTRRDPRPRRLRGSHQVHPSVRPARPRRGPAVGGDRPADPGVPLVPPAGRAARAPPQDRRGAAAGHSPSRDRTTTW